MSELSGSDIFGLFERAAAIPADEREAFLASSGASDADRARVRAMLRADGSRGGLEDRAGLDLVATLTTTEEPELAELPTLRGYYRVIRLLGEGGSGSVYEAEQASPRRRVAIKAIRAGLASRRAVRRLRVEADILARLQHPGIAQVFEAGLGEEHQQDQAFIVMELVDGLPIHKHAAASGFDRRQRVALFLQVCDAVAHAHQRGVIHRDLKPANILVDAQGRTKVLDFGVARLLSDGSGRADATEQGMVVGTLGYMSPEQAAGRTDAVDVRTDVYALGAVLYELLVGRPALPISGASMGEALRIIETQTPRSPGAFDRALRGDLSVIVMRALEKDPERRFPSVGAMAEDLRRYLDGRPIRSRPQSLAYIAARQARRHWVITAMGLLLVVLLLGFSVKSTTDAARFRSLAESESRARSVEASARHTAERERARADELNRALQVELAAADIERARLETRAGNGSAAEAILWPAFFRDPESLAVQGALWELFESHPCQWTARVEGGFKAEAWVGDARHHASAEPAWIAIGDRAGGVALLDPKSGRELGVLAADEDRSLLVALVAASAERLWVVQRSGRVRIVAIGSMVDSRVGLGDESGGDESGGDGSGEVFWLRVVETRAAGEQPSAFALHVGAGLAATAYSDGRVVIDSMASDGARFGAWRASARAINAAVFSEDGAHLCVAGTDRVVRVYEVATGELLHELVGHERDVYALAFDPKERAVWSLAVDQTLRRWSLETGESSVEARVQDFPRVLSHRGDGTIALVETDRAWLQERARGALRSVAYPRSSFVHAVVLGDAVVTIEGTGEVRRWSTRFRPSIEPIRAHRNWIFGADFSAVHDLLVTSSGDESVRFSDASGLRELGRFELPRHVRARCVRFSPDESIVAVGGSDGIVRIFDAATRTLVGTLAGPGGEIYALAFTPDGATLAAGASSRAIRCWSLGDRAAMGSGDVGGSLSWDLTGLESIPRGLVFSRDGGRLFGSGAANGILVIDPAQREIESIIPTSAEPWSVAISPDGRRLASGLFDASVVCIDLETRAISVGTTRHRLVVAGLDFSSDGRLIVSGGDDGAVRIWDSTGAHLRAVRLIDAGSGPVPLVRFAPGGSRVFAGTSVGMLLRWDLETHLPAIARNVAEAASSYATDESGIDPSRGLEWAKGR